MEAITQMLTRNHTDWTDWELWNTTLHNDNDSNSSKYFNEEDISLDTTTTTAVETILFAVLMTVGMCATVVGNVLVILSVFTYRPLRCVQNFYIVSLASADMAVTLLVMPFNVVNSVIGHWVFGAVICNAWLTCDILTCTASILHLCAISVDRYYAISQPIEYAQKRTSKVRLSLSVCLICLKVISRPNINLVHRTISRIDQIYINWFLAF